LTTTSVDFSVHVKSYANHAAKFAGSRYTSKKYIAREWSRVWTKLWLFAGVKAVLREAEENFLFEICHKSIIIARTENGEIAAVFNVCQHRGNRMLTRRRGNLNVISCSYHRWSYSLDGSLRRVPDEARFMQGLPCDRLSLKAVRVELGQGFTTDPRYGTKWEVPPMLRERVARIGLNAGDFTERVSEVAGYGPDTKAQTGCAVGLQLQEFQR
jgi:nitrite reductase/ring-hydroxylating ferredoxin subunit